MKQDRIKKNRGLNRVFLIQLLECMLVALFLNMSFTLAGKLIYNDSFPYGYIDGILMYSIMCALAIIILGANKYFRFVSKPLIETLTKISCLVIVWNFIYIALVYFSKNIQLSVYYFIVTATFQILFLLLIKRFSYVLKTSIFRKRVSLVIGKNQQKNQLLHALKDKSLGKLAFANYEDEKLKDYVDCADNVFLSGLLSKKLKDRIISYCILKEKKVFIVPETYEIAMRKAEMAQLGDIPLFAIESFRLTEAQNFVKRLMDILLSIFGIILSSPLMIYAAIRIKLEDGGPVFYKQERSGLNGRPFNVIKFRSMIEDAEKHTGAVFAKDEDNRITRIGKLIRATRIDEIPQFFNVLSGSMSLVGPRPERPVFVEEFSKEIPEYTGRLAVKPGITGLAQVMGNYTTSAENKAKFDLIYIRDYSFLLDLRILIKTVGVMLYSNQSRGFSEHTEIQMISMDQELQLGTDICNCSKETFPNHRIGKSILIAFCCLVVITGCMFLRYSALAVTMIEASYNPVNAVKASTIMDEGNTNVDQPDLIQNEQKAYEMNGSAIENDGTVSNGSIDVANQSEDSSPLLANTATYTEKQAAENENVVLSQDEIEAALDKMSLGDKLGAAYHMISRLGATDLIILENLSEGGFTENEKARAKEMMYQYYDAVEIEYIKKVYWEYME